jgi:ABC-type transporter Mla maintaining outer membrane lipid asymmetry ATPase subunit MlaF
MPELHMPTRRLAAGGSLAVVRDALEAAVAESRPEVERLTYAKVTVGFRVTSEPGHVSLLLDRDVPEVHEGEGEDQINIDLTPEQALRFAAGQLRMATMICTGRVAATGPVRKYLEVDPIVQHLLSQAADPPCNPGAAPRSRTSDDPIDPDLLAVETRDLHKSFGGNEILRGIDLRIPEGVISAILGPSGTGKSVLLQHIIGLLKPDKGDVLIRGVPLSKMSRSQVLRLRTEIGVMFQDGALFSAMNIEDNVAFPLRQHTDLGEAEIRDVVNGRLAEVGLGNAARAMPSQLSGGMRKRAGLARALVLEPSMVLCDEPDSGLDPVRTALLGDLMREQHAANGGTMIVITHNIALAKRVSDHMSVIWRGKIIADGMIDEMLETDNDFVRQFLAAETVGPLGMDV